LQHDIAGLEDLVVGHARALNFGGLRILTAAIPGTNHNVLYDTLSTGAKSGSQVAFIETVPPPASPNCAAEAPLAEEARQ
jgi:hypothetical protein